MSWLDVLAILILLAATVLQTMRGFGRAVFDTMAIYGVLWLASVSAEPVAHMVPIGSDKAVNLAFAYGLVGILGSIVGLVLSHFCYQATLPHAGMFEHFFGLMLGVAVGAMFCHMLMRGIAFADPNGDGSGELVTSGIVASEMYDFHTYHSIVDSITGLTADHTNTNSLDQPSAR
jgi:uncharacterized membrane protein required for colicin V production